MSTMSFRKMMIGLATGVMAAMMISTAALAWDDSVQGEPDQFDAGAKGYFVWHNDEGWQLRTHDDPQGAVFHGHIRTDGVFRNVDLVRAESTEDFTVTDDGHTINFRFRTRDHVDGLNFRVDGGSHLRFDLETNGHQTLLRHIFLGDAGRHPLSNPFTLGR